MMSYADREGDFLSTLLLDGDEFGVSGVSLLCSKTLASWWSYISNLFVPKSVRIRGNDRY